MKSPTMASASLSSQPLTIGRYGEGEGLGVWLDHVELWDCM